VDGSPVEEETAHGMVVYGIKNVIYPSFQVEDIEGGKGKVKER
jgi:hypothetical protein